MNDPLELFFSLKSIEEINSEIIMDQIKNFFVISFCEYNPLAKEREHFSMWRNYADNSNGIGIIFKLSNYNLNNRWIDSVLGKVDYDPNSLSLRGIRKYFQALKSENNFYIQNLPTVIFQIASLHKAPIWAEENEIRLSRFLKWDKTEWPYKYNKTDFSNEIKTTFANSSVKYFIEMDLDNQSRLQIAQKVSTDANRANPTMKFTAEEAFDIYSSLTIEKIILGYRLSNDVKHDIANACRLLAYQNLGINLQFENSIFTDYFKI